MGIEDGAIKRARASTYLFRSAAATLRARVDRANPEAVARTMFSGDPVTGILTRAATTPATITGTGWADALAATSIQDLLMQIASVSAAAALIGRGLQLDFAGYASIKVPGRLVDASDAGSWVIEDQPAPVRSQRITGGTTLVPRKLVVNTSYTQGARLRAATSSRPRAGRPFRRCARALRRSRATPS
jgi:hypothetical protein